MYRQTSTPQSNFIWNSKFANIKWTSVSNFNQKYCVTNKIKEVTFKALHLIYPKSQVVARFCAVERNRVVCDYEGESICHLFFKCFHNRTFWLDVEQFYNAQTNSKFRITGKDVLLFYESGNANHQKVYLLNLLILYG